MATIRIALVGLGKISRDEHVPAIAANAALELVAGVSPNSEIVGVSRFERLEQLLASIEVDAVAINTPPMARSALARVAIAAGKHVLLEKPPCATASELLQLEAQAREAGVTLYTAWHSQHAPAVEPARRWLARTRLRHIEMRWRENVREWHPGQRWIWDAGGFGVFDPGINALSILTRILPARLTFASADFRVPGNCQTPVAAAIAGHAGDAPFVADLDFLQTGRQTWSIGVDTDHGALLIDMGGRDLFIDGERKPLPASREYPSIYARFVELVRSGASEVDAAPLQLAADAFLLAHRTRVDDFVE